MTVNKVVRLGSINTGRRWARVYCKIEFKEGKLSISGVEGPLSSGNALGSCGQIDMHLRDKQHAIKLAPGWTRSNLAKFFDVWKDWHLNDMKAGTPAQMAELAKHTFPGYPTNHYEWACAILKDAGLYEVQTGREVQNANGQFVPETYKYGSAWLREDVPQDVIEFLTGLPDTDMQPAWV